MRFFICKEFKPFYVGIYKSNKQFSYKALQRFYTKNVNDPVYFRTFIINEINTLVLSVIDVFVYAI